MASERTPRKLGAEQEASFDERKLMVLRAAARLISEKGFKQTSIDDIAAELNVTKPTVYHYVGSKDGIIIVCLETGSSNLEAFVKHINTTNKSGKEKIAALMKMHTQSVGDDFGRCLISVDHKALKPASQKEMERYSNRYIEIVQSFVEDGIADGSIQSRNPLLVTHCIVGAFNSVARWYEPNDNITTKEIADTFLSVFDEGL